MDTKNILDAIKKLKTDSAKRQFIQSVDIIITLKDLNWKNPEEQVEFFVSLPHGTGDKQKICALVGPELMEEAKKTMDETILPDDYAKYDKRTTRKLARQYDYFIAQANIMNQIAAKFGRFFGPKGKMPNPKAGCIVPPKGNLKPVYDRLQKMIKISSKKGPFIHVKVGKESMSEEQLAENIKIIYEQLTHTLPKAENNIRNLYVKLTMSKPVKV
ncbi:MAG TPA: 50S ribosomal protein L1 [Candidatus Nanoarchaeia archaeon]|nr:50S ribosomal protein L1 [Candidatus Nanoarchaeia archaeon]